MKRLLVALLLLAWLPLGAAIAFVQQKTNVGSNSLTIVVTLDASPTAGNALVCTISADSTSDTVSSVSGAGVTWALGKAQTVNANCEIWYGLNSSGSGTAITVTYAGKTDGGVNCQEYSGIATTSALDVTGGQSGNSTSPATGNIDTTNADDLLVAASRTGGQNPTAGPTNSFNALTRANTGGQADLNSAYLIVSSTGTYSTGWTIPSSPWDAPIISLKAAGGGGTVVKDPIMRGMVPVPR